jgi:Glutathione S-transferase, N-terminal domain
VKLYICYGTFPVPLRPGGHPCGVAHHALEAAGHHPEVIRSYGLGPLPGLFNRTRGRREVKELTGSYQVPVLVTDEGEVVTESAEIVRWAQTHPAGTPRTPAATV